MVALIGISVTSLLSIKTLNGCELGKSFSVERGQPS